MHLDTATEALLLFLVLFTPWAFGTTQSWSVWTANLAGYAIGALLIAKWVVRQRLEFQPAHWGEAIVVRDESGELAPPPRPRDGLTVALAVATVVLLGYVLVGALNARAVFDPALRQFEYLREPLRWLPHSYDRAATWAAFAQYLALACVFWGARDWLLLHTGQEDRDESAPRWAEPSSRVMVPVRLRRLLWVLCLSTVALVLVGALQRADGTNKLLWILGSRSNKPADNIFGPWSYRANAAQYFNLVWPVCLAFWLWLQEHAARSGRLRSGRYDGPHLVLLPAAMFIAAGPVISSSRGGAFVCAGMGVLCTAAILFLSRRLIAASARWITVGSLAGAAALGILAGWSSLKERLARPDYKFSTGFDAGTNDFTLLVRAQLGAELSVDTWRRLVALSPIGRSATGPRNFSLYITPQGALFAHRFGNTLTNHAALTSASGVVSNAAGQSLLFSVTRREGLRLHLDGEPLPATLSYWGVPTNWLDFVSSRYVITGDPGVSEVALVNLGLTDDELKATAGLGSLTDLESRLLHADADLPDPQGPAKGGFQPGEGSTLESARRPTEPNTAWLALRRDSTPGPLMLTRNLEGAPDPRLRGPVRLALKVWNPNDTAIRVEGRVDEGPAVDEWVEPRADATIHFTCRAPHPGPVRRATLAFSRPEGAEPLLFPDDSSIYVRELSLTPGAIVVARRLTHEIRLFDLADRMSGRNEYYENAVQMLADYPVWGSGAGTFSSVYQLYMKPGQDWAAYLHNDWMETRITLGLVGLGLVIAGLVLLVARSAFGRGLSTPRVVVVLVWIALGGCLIHARFDYPFQVYSVLFLFVLLGAVLTVLTARKQP